MPTPSSTGKLRNIFIWTLQILAGALFVMAGFGKLSGSESSVDGMIVETPARGECWAAQTPQVIRRDWLVEAVAAAKRTGRLGTDDAQLVEWLGKPVQIVEARCANLKITRPEDLVLAESLLAERAEK